jgi:ketosteroid isomerase-like protein
MRHAAVLACLLVLPAAPAAAAAGDYPADEAAIKALSATWAEAIERKDRPRLESLLAPEFVLTAPGHPREREVDRKTWLDNAIGKDWSGFRYENQRVRVHGSHAVSTSHLRFHLSPIPFEMDSAIVDLWEKRDGRWQVTTRMLAESEVQSRIAFVFGVVASALALVLWRLVRRLMRRRG